MLFLFRSKSFLDLLSVQSRHPPLQMCGKGTASLRLAIFGAGLVVSSSFCSRAAEVGSEVHAAVITSIAGAPTPAGTVTYMSVPLLSGVYAGGRISSITGNRVVDSSTNWTDGLYNGNAGRYYILITSGAALGWTAEITATLGSIHALDLAQAPPSTAQVGDSYRVRRYASVDSVFSDLNATTAQAAGNPSDADNLILYDATTKRSTSLFKSNVSGFDGWFDSAYSAGGTNILPPGTGWMLRRRATASAQLFGVGVVRSEGLSRTVQPGLNLLGTVHASDSPALSNLGLYTGSPTTGVRAGIHWRRRIALWW